MNNRTHIEGESERILKLQHELVRVLADAVDPERGLREVLERVLALPGLDGVWAWFRYGDSADFHLNPAVCPNDALTTELDTLAAGSGLVERLLARRETVGPWSEVWQEWPEAAARAEWAEGAIVPVFSDGEVVGALGAGLRRGSRSHPEYLWLLRAVADAAGSLLAVVRRETTHRSTSDNLARLLSAFSDHLLIVAPDGRLLFHNLATVGLPVSGRVEDFLPDFAAIRKLAHAQGGSQAGGPVPRARLVDLSGQEIPVEVYLEEGSWDDSPAEIVICRDISGRLDLALENERLVTAIDQVSESILITNAQGEITYVNPSCCRMTGYSRGELIGQNPRLLKSGCHDDEFYRDMWATLRRGQVWSGQIVNKRRNGELFTEEATLNPVLDDRGAITHYVGVKRDVTAEIKLAERLRERQKMEAVGTLAGGIAHDFNNILYALLGYVDLALDDIPVGHPARGALKEVSQAGDRASSLVARMLAFGRRGDGTKESCSLNDILSDGLELIRAGLPGSIRIKSHLPPTPCPVSVDVSQIQQVLVSLCQNAAEAMAPEGGDLKVSLTLVDLDSVRAQSIGGLQPGRWACLQVVDTGRGIAPALLNRIFEPYFTTRSGQIGNGLGLATVHGIIAGHGGRILATSQQGVGTEFTIYLPTVAAGAAAPAEPERAADETSKSRIMVVDDEPMVADFLATALNRLGYDPLVFESGLTALEVFKDDPLAVDIVITDQAMPGLTGFELASRMLAIRPDLPIVMTTGYAEDVTQQQAAEVGIRQFMAKPIQLSDLSEALSTLVSRETVSS